MDKIIEKKINDIVYAFPYKVYVSLFTNLIFIKNNKGNVDVILCSDAGKCELETTIEQCIEWANNLDEELLTLLVKNGVSIQRLIKLFN